MTQEKDMYFAATKVIAPPLDTSKFLNDGEVDVTHMKDEEISERIPTAEIRKLCRGLRIDDSCPVNIFIHGFFKKSAYEAMFNLFHTKEELVAYLKNNRKKIVVYQVLHNKIFNTWGVRQFSVAINPFMWWYRKFRYYLFRISDGKF